MIRYLSELRTYGMLLAVMLDNKNTINDQVDLIVQSGVLGRSPVYVRLLRYLAKITAEDRTASEIDIATDVFRKGGDFDSNQDSSVRVYVHNLRQRLSQFYSDYPSSELRLSIPKGEYKLNFAATEVPVTPLPQPSTKKRTPSFLALSLAALIVCNLAWLAYVLSPETSKEAQIAQSPVWMPILQGDRPLLVVVGDYFIFGELDSQGRVSRMVREFNVNSREDLLAFKGAHPSSPDKYRNLDLSYLPQSTAFALNDVLSVVHSQEKEVNVIPASRLRTSDLKSNDILYVGYLSGLGILESYVFAASQLQIGATYDEIVNPESGKYHLSTAGVPERKTYQDFAFLASFPGPGIDNHVLVAAGTRDAGLMFIAESLSSSATIGELSERMSRFEMPISGTYEALYRVVGSDRTSLNATLVHDAVLDENRNWAQQN